MGFKARHTYQLVLPERLTGLQVEVRGRPLGEYFQPKDIGWENDPDITADEKAERYRAFYKEFLGDVVSWNLEDDDGTTVPLTEDALLGLDEEILSPVVYAWMNRQVTLPAPLSGSSTDTDIPGEVAQIPMETLSDHQAS